MTKTESFKDILQTHNLRITNCRLDVIDFFMKENSALSLGDLEHQFTQYDRVTLYRTLNSFLDSGILHKIPNSTGTATYGLCHETCSPQHHEHNHIHFKCNKCGQIVCLENMTVPSVSVPTGYQIESVNVIAEGICEQCA